MTNGKNLINKTVKIVEKDANTVLDIALDECVGLFNTGKKEVLGVVKEVKKFKK